MAYDPGRPVVVMEQEEVAKLSPDEEARRNIVAYRIDRVRYGAATSVPPGSRRKDLVVWCTPDGLPPTNLRRGQFGYGMRRENILL